MLFDKFANNWRHWSKQNVLSVKNISLVARIFLSFDLSLYVEESSHLIYVGRCKLSIHSEQEAYSIDLRKAEGTEIERETCV